MIVRKTWGWEEVVHNADGYCGKILTVLEGRYCSLHYHKRKHETFLVTDGQLYVDLGCETFVASQGRVIVVEPGCWHRFKALTPMARFIEFSTEDWPEDTVRIEPGSSGRVEA